MLSGQGVSLLLHDFPVKGDVPLLFLPLGSADALTSSQSRAVFSLGPVEKHTARQNLVLDSGKDKGVPQTKCASFLSDLPSGVTLLLPEVHPLGFYSVSLLVMNFFRLFLNTFLSHPLRC